MPYLYHYSTEIHQTLMTKAASGGIPPEQIKQAREENEKEPYELGAYCDHISFFFEPLPSQLLSELFHDHPFWFAGHHIYEHVVDLLELPTTIPYHVVESERKTWLYDQFVIEHNWVDDNPHLISRWIPLEDQKTREWGEKGYNRAILEHHHAVHQGTLANSYKKAVQRADFEWNKTKYAANVPHVMLYPPHGRIRPTQIMGLVIGSDYRHAI